MNAIRSFLFETAVWIPLGVTVIGLMIAFAALARVKSTPKTIGLGVAAFGLIWAACTFFVTTAVEAAEQRTRDLVLAYEQSDWDRFGDLLDPDTQLDTVAVNDDEIVDRARRTHEQLNHGDVTVTSSESKIVGPDKIDVRIEVSSSQDVSFAERTTTAWSFLYTERNDQWQLDKITILPSRMIDPEMVRSKIAKSPGAIRSAPRLLD